MKDTKEWSEDFDKRFQAERERFEKLRAEMDAERENRPTYHELERMCAEYRLFVFVLLATIGIMAAIIGALLP